MNIFLILKFNMISFFVELEIKESHISNVGFDIGQLLIILDE